MEISGNDKKGNLDQKEVFYANHDDNIDPDETGDSKLIGISINDAAIYDDGGYGDCGDDDVYVSAEPDTPVEEIIQTNVSKNIRDLRTFFDKGRFITEKGDQTTNCINVAEKRTYHIPETHIEDFFGLLEMCRMERRIIHYSERQETAARARSGIMLDFDYYQTTKDNQLTHGHFETLSRKVGQILGEVLDVHKHMSMGGGDSYDDFSFRVFFIRKPEIVLAPTVDAPGRYKDGFHMLIPEIMVSKGLKKHIIEQIIAKNILTTTFRGSKLHGGPNDTLDKMSSSVPVQFVGNTRPGKPAYNLTYACEVKLLADDGYTSVNTSSMDVTPLNRGEVLSADTNKPMPINLCYELSVYFNLKTINGAPTWLKKCEMDYKVALETQIQHAVEKSSRGILDEKILSDNENTVDILALNNAEAAYLKRLLGILDVSYATEYKKWFSVMMAIAHTGLQYKPLAVWFSHRRPESFSSGEFERVWGEAIGSKYAGKPVTKRAIREWARISSPALFETIDKENYANVLAREAYSNEGRIEHAGVAKVTHAMTSYKFVVDSDNQGARPIYQWYEFVTDGQAMRPGEVFKWRLEGDPDNIHLFIGEHMPKVFAQLATTMKDRATNAANENEAKYWKNVLKNFKTSSSRLGNDGFQKGIINQCKYRFRQRGFLAELDSYKDIIGVGNGVLKLGTNPELIRGFHEYKISKYTETCYKPYDPANPHIQTLLAAFRDIWVEPDVFEFMMMHASTGLDCNEAANILLMCIGGGRNGKSFWNRMIHETLGDMYCSSGKSTLLVGGFEKGNEANSAQMQQKGKRYFYIDEFEQCSVLNTTRMKSCVSPNKQSGRDLFEKQSNFKNTCNTAAFSNFDFIVDTPDHGTWRRIYYYKNKVRFCENPNPNNKYEKKVDRRFMDVYPHDKDYREAMLSILVHYQAKLCREYGGDIALIPVPTIMYETELFRNRQDSLNRFITTMLVKSPGAEIIRMTTLSAKYSDWYNIHIKKYTGKNSPSDAGPLFENSCLADALKSMDGCSKYLEGYRILSSEAEELAAGESRIGNAAVILQPVVVLTPEVLAQECAAVVESREHWFADDLAINAKPYIQSSEITVNPEMAVAAMDDFINGITAEGETVNVVF